MLSMRVVLLACVPAALLMAQTPKSPAPIPTAAPVSAPAKPAVQSPRPHFTSPDIGADGTVTLRLYAPAAHTVTVVGEFAARPEAMTKAANGVWSLTVGPLEPHIYTYQYEVDGVPAPDPLNPSVVDGFGYSPPGSSFEVSSSSGPAFYDAQPVPHGEIHIVTYHSAAIGAPRKLWIYTPPGYETGRERYPVFYLMHGSGGSASDWARLGRENYVLDNLIAAGKARPMIIVNPFVYPWPGIDTGTQLSPIARGGQSGADAERFQQDLLRDVVPYVDSHFRTSHDADDRALGGLSMGGARTISIGFTHTDLFHSLVIMSAGANDGPAEYPAFFADPAKVNATLRLLWLGLGSEDQLMTHSADALSAALTKAGIHHDFWVLPGRRHEWIVWRNALRTVAPMLFR